MSTLNLTKSTRKFIRLEKARIRRQFLDFKKQEEMIGELYKQFLSKPVAVAAPVKAEVKRVKTEKVKTAAKPKAVKAKKAATKA